MSEILIPASVGELIDKMTILEIKVAKIKDPQKHQNVARELETLSKCFDVNQHKVLELIDLRKRLKKVNEALWKIEDDIRSCERKLDFGATFIDLARNVYIQNDKRAAIKKEINLLAGSSIIEEKSYADY